jgi:hypothetical protein
MRRVPTEFRGGHRVSCGAFSRGGARRLAAAAATMAISYAYPPHPAATHATAHVSFARCTRSTRRSAHGRCVDVASTRDPMVPVCPATLERLVGSGRRVLVPPRAVGTDITDRSAQPAPTDRALAHATPCHRRHTRPYPRRLPVFVAMESRDRCAATLAIEGHGGRKRDRAVLDGRDPVGVTRCSWCPNLRG